MTRQYPVRCLALFFVASAALWGDRSFAQADEVSASYSLESSVLSQHEPVIVHLDVLNESPQPITLRLGRNRLENFSFVIRWPDGSEHKRPPTPLREGIYDPGDVSLDAGRRLRHLLLLNEWAEFPGPGEYQLDVQLLTPIELSSGEKVLSKPYHTSFQVLPRDESRLRAACERLVQKIDSTWVVRDLLDAGSALGHVDDPIVVPYLERALQSRKYVDQPIIDGLTRIGNEAAARILMTVVKESPAWPPSSDTTTGTRAILAWQALHAIAATTANERLKEEIRRSVP